MEWLKQLSMAIDYIEENLTGEISFERAAEIACCSEYYFQRMFSYVAGIPLSEYIRRRKMTQAAFELQNRKTKILDLSLKYGYSSPTSFNRAFQKVHGVSPSAAKTAGSRLKAYPPIRFTVSVTGESPMPYRIEQKQAMRIVGRRIAMAETMEENHRIIPQFWQKLQSGEEMFEIARLMNQKPEGLLGVSVFHEETGPHYYIAAASDLPVPAGMFEYRIPAADWVVFECRGDFKNSVQSVFRRFITEWLPFSGYEYAYLPDIEVYPDRDENSGEFYSEVWVGIKKKGD